MRVGNWFRQWWTSRQTVARLELELDLARRRSAHLEEIVAAYRDTLETYQREAQVRTAAALAEREAYRHVDGGRAR